MMRLLVLKTVAAKSLATGIAAGGAIQAVVQTTTDNSHTQLVLGLFSLIGVVVVAGTTAFTNIYISKRNANVDMKEVRRLRKENREQASIIKALTDREGTGNESHAQAG